jgi:small neutral amino acid transporter SnatA (MarC family)
MMDNLLTHILTVFVGFFAIMNPITNTPIFLGLTGGDDAGVRRAVARRAVVLAFGIVVVFCMASGGAIGRLDFPSAGHDNLLLGKRASSC